MDCDKVLMEEVSPDQIEVEVETSETYLFDPLIDHNYNLTGPRHTSKSILPHNIKIRELKALFHCKICGYATLKKPAMDAHSRTHKEKAKPVQPAGHYVPCPSCNVTKQLETYEKCSQCSYFTKKKTSLKIHMKIHMEAKPYKCTECDHRSTNLKELIKHYEEGHGSFKKFRCDLCNFVTHARAKLSAHHETHGQRRCCAVCSFTTEQEADLDRHMKTHYVKLNK